MLIMSRYKIFRSFYDIKHARYHFKNKLLATNDTNVRLGSSTRRLQSTLTALLLLFIASIKMMLRLVRLQHILRAYDIFIRVGQTYMRFYNEIFLYAHAKTDNGRWFNDSTIIIPTSSQIRLLNNVSVNHSNTQYNGSILSLQFGKLNSNSIVNTEFFELKPDIGCGTQWCGIFRTHVGFI